MPEAPAINLVPVAAEHLAMLHGWLHEPHVREWWGDPDHELELIEGDIGSELTRGYVAYANDAPVAYIQCWVAGFYDGEPWQKEMPVDTLGIDVLVGDAVATGKGLGPRVIRAFAAKLFKHGTPRLIIDPDTKNHRAIRAYEKSGFKEFARYPEPDGGTVLMELTHEDFKRTS
jgi:aminoglycoside 6'-N-acetyltransferase